MHGVLEYPISEIKEKLAGIPITLIFSLERERETGFSEASVRLGFCTSSKIVVILAECRKKGSFKVRNIKTSQAVGFYDCNMVHYGPAQGA